ncbi:serine hydrolase [Streptomyces griseoaurantiacus]|uniref:serine hydrolase n=1 Tax=Streptomyces griseoaurantiacus TaxID=68213 RepID=UPI00363710D3
MRVPGFGVGGFGSGEAWVGSVGNAADERGGVLTEAMRAVPVPDRVRVSVAVLDRDSGAHAAYGEGEFVTASVVKVDILAALLLRARDAGRPPTARERAHAAAMIERSDNDSASALWEAIGRAEGLDAANARFGLRATRGGEGPLWGLTRTTAADRLRLLRQVYGEGGPCGAPLLDADSRAYVRELMGNVVADQRWGVSAAAGLGRGSAPACALKNGWLPRSATGLWVVHSIGRITTAEGHRCLMAVLSDGHATLAEGIAVVEAAARAAAGLLAGGGEGTGAG